MTQAFIHTDYRQIKVSYTSTPTRQFHIIHSHPCTGTTMHIASPQLQWLQIHGSCPQEEITRTNLHTHIKGSLCRLCIATCVQMQKHSPTFRLVELCPPYIISHTHAIGPVLSSHTVRPPPSQSSQRDSYIDTWSQLDGYG